MHNGVFVLKNKQIRGKRFNIFNYTNVYCKKLFMQNFLKMDSVFTQKPNKNILTHMNVRCKMNINKI